MDGIGKCTQSKWGRDDGEQSKVTSAMNVISVTGNYYKLL